MKRFFLCLGLLLLPLAWSVIVLAAGAVQIFDSSASDIQVFSFLCMGGCLLLAVLFSIFGQLFSSKTCCIFGLLFGLMHFSPICADAIGIHYFSGIARFYSLPAALISLAMFLMIVANSIIVFCRKKKPAVAAGQPVDMAPFTARMDQLEGQIANLSTMVSGLPKAAELKSALDAYARKVHAIEKKVDQLAQQKPASPVKEAPAPVKEEPAPVKEEPAPVKEEPAPVKEEPAPVKEEPAPVKEEPAPVKEEPAPVKEEPAPVKEEPAPVKEEPAPVKEEPAPVKEEPAPVKEEPAPVKEEPAPVKEEPAPAPTAVPAVRKPIEYVLQGAKGVCIISDTGVRYQLKGQDFFAAYKEIDNLYVMLGVPYVMYKGKDYHIDVFQRNAQEKGMLKAAMAFGQEKWNAAKAQAAAVTAVALNPHEPIYTMDNKLGTLKVYDTYCLLTAKKNATTLLVTNKFYAGEKKFYYSDLISVQFREPGAITDGYIEFETPGARGSNNMNAYTSENALSFAKPHLPLMREIYTFIDGKIREAKERKNQPAVAALSSADELKKFKELLDAGIITQEEFDQKKKQLMGL